MKLKKLFQYGFITTCLLGNVMAMDDQKSDDALLIVGCRPWDDNVKGVSGLETAHFVDFMTLGAPTPMPSNFHHVDLNDTGANSAGKFTDFAACHSEEFKTITIDWMTCHHIRRDGAWTDFTTLLRPGGKLIVPVTKSNNSGSISKQTAQEIVDSKLTDLFGAVEILSHDTMPTDTCFDLLRRDGMGITECALSFTPAIIVATKGLAVSKKAFNPLVGEEEVSAKIEAKLSIESQTKAGDEPSPIAISTEITIENKDMINEATHEPSTPVFSSKPTIIHSVRHCPNLYLKIKNNAEAIQKIYYDESHNLQGRSRDFLLEIRRELREAEDIIDTIENSLTTTRDRELVASFSSDREDGMQRYMLAVKKYPELSGWLEKIGFKW